MIPSSFKQNLPGFIPWNLPVVQISPEWVTVPEQGTSSGRIGTFSLWTGMFRDRKTITESKMCVLIFSTNSVWNISHSKINWARCDRKYIPLFMQSTQYSGQILIKFEFSRHISEKYISNFMKIRQWEPSCCIQTDMTKLIVAFRNFANAP